MATHRTVVPKTLGRYRVWRSIHFCFALAPCCCCCFCCYHCCHYHLSPPRCPNLPSIHITQVTLLRLTRCSVGMPVARAAAMCCVESRRHGRDEQKVRKQRTGVEPVAFWVATRCSTNLSYRCWRGGCTARRGLAVEDGRSGGMCQECAPLEHTGHGAELLGLWKRRRSIPTCHARHSSALLRASWSPTSTWCNGNTSDCSSEDPGSILGVEIHFCFALASATAAATTNVSVCGQRAVKFPSIHSSHFMRP